MITAEDTLLHDDEGEKTSPWPAIGLAAFAILVGIFVVKYGLGTLAWLEAKSLADSNAWVADVPQPFAQASASASAPDGKIDRVIEMPVSRPTNCTFGGPHGNVLYVTSASPAAGHWERFGGGLFALETNVTGLEENKWMLPDQ